MNYFHFSSIIMKGAKYRSKHLKISINRYFYYVETMGNRFDNAMLWLAESRGHSDPRLLSIVLLLSCHITRKSMKLVFEIVRLVLGSASHKLCIF